MAGLLVVPGIKLEKALDRRWLTFLEVFSGNLRQSSPKRYVDKGDFLFFLAALSRRDSIDCQTELSDCRTLRGVTEIWISGEVPD